MKIINRTKFPIIVNCYVEKLNFGPDHMVMPGETEDVPGPLMLETPEGKIYMKVEGVFTVVEGVGLSSEVGVLKVSFMRPCSHVWKALQGKEGIRVRHFRDLVRSEA